MKIKQKIALIFLLSIEFINAQSNVKTLNSGSIIAPKSVISIGEIIINPVSPNQSSSGIIGILAQVNQQQLEVKQFDLSNNIKVFPNPTEAKIYFETTENLQNETVSIFNNTGQLVTQTKIATDNSVDLESLATGVYLIQFSNKNYSSFKIIKH